MLRRIMGNGSGQRIPRKIKYGVHISCEHDAVGLGIFAQFHPELREERQECSVQIFQIVEWVLKKRPIAG